MGSEWGQFQAIIMVTSLVVGVWRVLKSLTEIARVSAFYTSMNTTILAGCRECNQHPEGWGAGGGGMLGEATIWSKFKIALVWEFNVGLF